MRAVVYRTQGELEDALAKWQRILLLQDWDIRIRFARQSRIGECDGSVKVWWDQMQAGISVCELDDANENRYEGFEFDMEHVLVHELIHIRMHPLTPKREDALLYDFFEQFINSQARAILALQRRVEYYDGERLACVPNPVCG